MKDKIILALSTQTIAIYLLDLFHALTFPTVTLTIIITAIGISYALNTHSKENDHANQNQEKPNDATNRHPYQHYTNGICCHPYKSAAQEASKDAQSPLPERQT